MLIPLSSHLFDESTPTLIFTDFRHQTKQDIHVAIDFEQDVLPQIMAELYLRKIQSLIVEGGAFLLQSFIQSQLWDEIRIETTDMNLRRGVKAPIYQGKLVNVQKCENSLISVYKNEFIP